MIDISYLFGAFIALVIAVILIKIRPIVKAAIPPTIYAVMSYVAENVVRAIEADYGRGGGDEKREAAFRRINEIMRPAIEVCEKMGFTFNASAVYEAIQAAWLDLNLEQIAVGEKLPAEDQEYCEGET